MDMRKGDATDGGGNQSYTLINLCEADHKDVKTSKIYPSVL